MALSCSRVGRSSVAAALALLLAAGRAFAVASIEPVAAPHAMVASTSPIASQVGVEVMRRGGNAVDAAVAVAFALAVVWPEAGNLGGGGFLLVRRADGTADFIDYRERAPHAATRDLYLDRDGRPRPGASTEGDLAVAVPGTVAGLALALRKHGTRPWAELLEPARRLAADGFVVDAATARSLAQAAPLLARSPECRRVFFHGEAPLGVGDRLVQPELAATLGRLQANGPRELYEGETARRIVDEMRAHGGLIDAHDLAEYAPVERAPLRGSYRGYELLTAPPPSSGGVLLLEMLNLLERHPVARLGYHSPDELHLLVEAARRAFADRAALLGDPDFVRVPVAELVAKSYAAARDRELDPARAMPSARVRAGLPVPREATETTHFSIVDEAGDLVANTFTLNGAFGSGVMPPGTGFLLNDEMDDFAAAPSVPNAYGLVQGEANAIAPRKRPLSTMTPTIVLKGGRPWLAIGSPGGPTIASTVLQVIVDLVDFGMNLREAIEASRVHHQWLPDVIEWEPRGLDPATRAALEARGHAFAPQPRYLGDAQGVMIDETTRLRLGASDPRGGGLAVGY